MTPVPVALAIHAMQVPQNYIRCVVKSVTGEVMQLSWGGVASRSKVVPVDLVARRAAAAIGPMGSTLG